MNRPARDGWMGMMATTCSMGAPVLVACPACLRCVKGVVAKQKEIIGNRFSRPVGGWADEPTSQANRMRADRGQTGGRLTQSQKRRTTEQGKGTKEGKGKTRNETKGKGNPASPSRVDSPRPKPQNHSESNPPGNAKDHRCDGRIESVIAPRDSDSRNRYD